MNNKKRKFTDEQVISLNKNKYVAKATPEYVVYSNTFKNLFINERRNGKKVEEIFKACGFDVAALGKKRMEKCSERWGKIVASGGTFKATNKINNYRNMTLEDKKIADLTKEVNRLKNKLSSVKENNALLNKTKIQNDYLRKENNYLKKEHLKKGGMINK